MTHEFKGWVMTMDLKTKLCSKIKTTDLQLLAIKLHYFFFWCGIGSSVIFVPLLAKDVGISASAVGVIYTITSLTTLISQPGFGAISDRFQNSRSVVMVIVVITGVTLYALLHIPQISVQNIILNCTENNFSIQPFPSYNITCMRSVLNRNEYCSLFRQNKNGNLNQEADDFCKGNKIPHQKTRVPSDSFNASTNSSCQKYLVRGCIDSPQYWTSCESPITSCFVNNGPQNINILWTYQLWIFSVLVIISQTMMYTCFSLSDAMCYEILGHNNEHLFGKQRLWSTCSYGLASFAAGYFNDLKSKDQISPNYSIGFYIMLASFFLDLIVLYRIPCIKVKMKIFSLKNIGQVLVSFEIIAFFIGAFLIGILTAIIWNYQFWFLKNIGASQTLIGLNSLFQSLIADVLFFLISGKIIQIFGNFWCLFFTFLAFAIRYFLYFFLKNPWHMLPAEILDGVTFSLFYVTLTGFAKTKAPLGVEATMIGLLVASFEGLGVASGSLLGGIGFDKLGDRVTFLVTGIGSVICAVVFVIIKIFMKDCIT